MSSQEGEKASREEEGVELDCSNEGRGGFRRIRQGTSSEKKSAA